MSKRRLWKKFAVAAATSVFAAAGPAGACTGIELIAADGSAIHARTLEFAIDLHSQLMMIPRGFARVGTTPDGKPGLSWKAKYASVGMNGVGLPWLFDGLNEKGLTVGLFYFPGSAGYMPYAAGDAPRTLAQWELGSYLLENFATVQEVREGLQRIVVPSVVFSAWGFAPETHYIVRDSSGASIVIEYVGGRLNIHDNPLGVITNSPTFDWHMTNLRNYLNFSLTNAPPVKIGDVTLKPTGQGSGMLGMPGDFTPPSRFVRAVAFSHSVFTPKDGRAAVLEAFHILNNFDIPKGAAREDEKDAHGNVQADYTLWTSAADMKAKRYYFRTYDNSRIRMVDLAAMNLDAAKPVVIDITGEEVIEQAHP